MHIQCTHCSSHYISSAHCSKSPVHTAAILSSAHCSKSLVHTAANLQCTLQLYYPVHTAAILSSAHCSKSPVHTAANLQCTLQLYYPVHTAATFLVPIPYSAHYIQCTSGPPKICNSPICYWWLVTD